MKKSRLFSVGLVLLGAAGVLAYDYYNALYTRPLVHSDPLRWSIAPGSSLSGAVLEMKQAGLLPRGNVLPMEFYVRLYARLNDISRHIKAGEYEIIPGSTVHAFFRKIVRGDMILERLRILEGMMLREVMQAMRRHDKIRMTQDDPEIIRRRLGVEQASLEGWFFPDTYLFTGGTDNMKLFRQGYQAMQRALDDAWEGRAPDLPLKTPYEALILASIVEKETASENERARIAGVFTARLSRGMRLQSDPTVIYALGERFDGNLRAADLRHGSAYNTYVHKKLPPTPIAMPGLASIRAVMHPDSEGTLYFVSKGDGTHYFSKTYNEHRKAVIKYQLGRAP